MLDTMASVADAHDRTGVRADGAGAPPGDAPSFRDVMAALNPLHHIPLVGPVYRAVSGDTLPEPARRVGSFVASGLMFGPLGLLSNAVTSLVERVTGFSVENTAQTVLAGLGLGEGPGRGTTPATPADSSGPASPVPPGPASPVPVLETTILAVAPEAGAPTAPATGADVAGGGAVGLSPAQLAAYGITVAPRGALRMGTLQDADVLNALELRRLAAPETAVAAYGRATPQA